MAAQLSECFAFNRDYDDDDGDGEDDDDDGGTMKKVK